MKLNRLFLRLLVTVSLITSGLANAQSNGDPNKFSTTPSNSACRFFDGFADNGNGTVTDPRDGLVWKRCAEGFEWRNNTCVGERQVISWVDAMSAAKQSRFLGFDDWRLPSKTELDQVVGREEPCRGNNAFYSPQYAASTMIAHQTSGNNGKFTGWYHSSSSTRDGRAWAVYFGSGNSGSEPVTDITHEVRLVRLGAIEGRKSQEKASVDKTKLQNESIKHTKAREAETQRIMNAPGRAAAVQEYQNKVKNSMACEAQKRQCVSLCPSDITYKNLKDSHCEYTCRAVNCD